MRPMRPNRRPAQFRFESSNEGPRHRQWLYITSRFIHEVDRIKIYIIKLKLLCVRVLWTPSHMSLPRIFPPRRIFGDGYAQTWWQSLRGFTLPSLDARLYQHGPSYGGCIPADGSSTADIEQEPFIFSENPTCAASIDVLVVWTDSSLEAGRRDISLWEKVVG
ncbi:MAG: hypothetical protein Q9224_000874 [Gallowayella concinna]